MKKKPTPKAKAKKKKKAVKSLTKPDKPHFSKKLRKHFIFIPGKIVHHARQVFLKLMDLNYKGAITTAEYRDWETDRKSVV